LKGFGIGLVAGVGLTVAGVGTGVYQMGRGLVNTPNAIKESSKGKEWNPETGEYFIYNLNEEA